GGIYSSLVLAGLPLLRSHYVGFAAGHVGNLGLKILLVAIIAGAVMAVGFVANWCLRRLFSSLAITQHYERWVEELPSHLMEWPAWLKKFCHRHWPALTAVGASYLLAIIGLWLTFSDLALGPANPEYNSFSYQVLNRQGTLIFTTILIWLFFKILQSITSKYWLSLCLTSGLMLVFFIADHIKLGLRDEPILPADVTSVQTFGEILKFVSVWVVIAGVVGVRYYRFDP
ncbi:LTA synthase family protein, partial [Limosilactobacillus fermentum]